MTTKALSQNFLNKELKDLAQQRGAKVLPEQATVKMADIAKVKLKQHAPVRPQ